MSSIALSCFIIQLVSHRKDNAHGYINYVINSRKQNNNTYCTRAGV